MTLEVNKLDSIARIPLVNLPTPMERLKNLESEFKGVKIFMKRDDLGGCRFGGNKERKLEFIMADALKKRCATIVTVGTIQSNHCRSVAAISNKFGMKTELILIKNNSGNPKNESGYSIKELLGAQMHLVKANEVQDKIKDVLKRLKERGKRPYFIEGGGHNVFGVMGYIQAVGELKQQLRSLGILPAYLVLPTGTGSTQAGLIFGKKLFNLDIQIIGISVSRSKKRCISEISNIIRKAEKYLKINLGNFNNDIRVFDDYIGRKYGIPTKKGMGALRLLAEIEGLIVDPIYNAKALAGMFDLISKSMIKGNIIFLNTGGFEA